MQIAKPKAILTYDKVIDIFKLRPDSKLARGAGSRASAAVAFDFGISEKTVRDIWRARTWHRETLHLDPCRPARAMALPGRPLGRKDSAPRRRGPRRRGKTSKLTRRQVVSSPADETTMNNSDTSKTDRFCTSSFSSAERQRLGMPPPLFFDDPFHDDWPHWSRADSFQLQGSHAAPPAAGIHPALQRKEPFPSEAAAPYLSRIAVSVLHPVQQPTLSPPLRASRSSTASPPPTASFSRADESPGRKPAQAAADLPPPPRPWPGDEALLASGLAGPLGR